MVSEGRYWIVLAVVAVVVAGGIVADAPDADSPPEPEELFESVFVHDDALDGVEGVRISVIERDGETVRTDRLRVRERPYVDYRHEVLDSTDGDSVGDVYVSNATGSWWYDPDAETVTVYEPDEPYANSAVRESRAAEAERQRERYDLAYRGTETVADRETHRLEVDARNESVTAGISLLVGDSEFVYSAVTTDAPDELLIVEQTVWIDAEHDYPVKERVVVEDPDGERYVFTERYETVTFDPDFDEDAFAFEIPPNAELERV